MTARERYYTVDVAAAATGVKPVTIRRWIKDGVISPLLHHGIPYVSEAQIRAAPEAGKRRGHTKLLRSLTIKDT